MTDQTPPSISAMQSKGASPLFLRDAEIRRGIELLYFGYSHLTRAVDARLATQGLGRAHHRALYFIARQPGMTVSNLLKLLAITKQSLGRVINELDARGLVESTTGASDRRQRLLYLTESGAALEASLFDDLRTKLSRAYVKAGQDAVTGLWQVLEGLIPDDDIARVLALQRED